MTFDQHQKYFWRDTAIFLDRAAVVLELVSNLDGEQKKIFLSGGASEELAIKLGGLPDRAFADEIIRAIESNPKLIVDCCLVRMSQDRAKILLDSVQRGAITLSEFEKKANERGDLSFGGLKLDGKKWAIGQIQRSESMKGRVVSVIVEQAIKDDDLEFFASLKRPQNRHTIVGSVPPFFMEYWCGEKGMQGCDRNDIIPPLCLFSDQALDDFASGFLKIQPQFDAIRKWRQRLGLIQLKGVPRIKKATFPNKDSVLLA